MARQAGMTLIELTVVLLVLVGLAGLMIPYVSGFVEKTHDSTGTNNLANLNGTMQRFHVQYNSYPDDLHSLIDVNGTPAIYGDLMNTSFLSPVTYVPGTDVALMSLRNTGISSVYSMIDVTDVANAGVSRTFGAGVASVPVTMFSGPAANTVTLAKLNAGDRTSVENHLAISFGRQVDDFDAACYDYIVMGVGQESEMTGRVMQEAPVHFAQNGDMAADLKYNRFLAVFQVDNNGAAVTGVAGTNSGCAAGTEQTKFIGTAMGMMPNHIIGLAEELNSTYSAMASK